MRMKWPLAVAVVVIFLILVGGCGESEFNRYLRELVEPPDEAIAMSATYQQVIDACNSGDLERAVELETANNLTGNRPACPEGGTASFEGLSWTLSGDRLTGTLRVERVRADNGCTDVQTPRFKNVEGIWLLDSINGEPTIFRVVTPPSSCTP